jgi:hypothetical protein
MEEAKKEAKVSRRTGVNRSLYITINAAAILKACRKTTRRSNSAVVSMLLEKYGPNITRDGRLLNI